MSNEIQDTQEKILMVACRLFAEGGFDGVTHRELAQEAGVNAALINYYFRSKEKLYEQVLDHCFQLTNKKYGISIEDAVDPLEGIAKIVRSRLLPVFDEGATGWFSRLIYHEMNSLSSNKEKLRKRYLLPLRKRLTALVACYLMEDEESLLVRTTVFNISSQWVMMNRARSRERGMFADGGIDAENIESVINNVLAFIIGGLVNVKKSLKSLNVKIVEKIERPPSNLIEK